MITSHLAHFSHHLKISLVLHIALKPKRNFLLKLFGELDRKGVSVMENEGTS